MTALDEVRLLLGYPGLEVVRRLVNPKSNIAHWILIGPPPGPCPRPGCGKVHPNRRETVSFVGGEIRNPKRLRARIVALGWQPSRNVDAEFGHDLVRALWRASKEGRSEK